MLRGNAVTPEIKRKSVKERGTVAQLFLRVKPKVASCSYFVAKRAKCQPIPHFCEYGF